MNKKLFFRIGTPSHKIHLIILPLFTNFHALFHKIIRDLYIWANSLHYSFSQSNFNYLKPHDELAGNNAFGYVGRSDTVARNLLGFINSVQWNVFKESPIRFPPTFRVDYKGKEKSCRGRNPCYTYDFDYHVAQHGD